MGPVGAVLIIASLVFVYQQINTSSSSPETAVAIIESGEAIQAITAQVDADAESNVASLTAAEEAEESPFAATDTEAADPLNEVAVATSAESSGAVAATVANNFNVPRQEPARFSLYEDSEPEIELVSDSDLVLVSASERGVVPADIVAPIFEELNAAWAKESVEESVEELVEEFVVDGVDLEPVQALVGGLPATDAQPQAIESSLVTDIAEAETNTAANTEIETEAEVAEVAEPEVEIVEARIEISSYVLKAVVDNWIGAWRNQVLTVYFDSYHPDFESRYHASKSAWLGSRERVIGGAEWIRLEMTEFRVVLQDDAIVGVQFWLSYQSPTYKDDTLKKLVLTDVDGDWLIIEEINLDVRT